jgi:glycoside/pentoside/hexuronide:cation symporter, GPH family
MARHSTPELILDAPPPLGLRLQLGYGLGSTAFGIGGVALSASLLQLFFNQVIGLPAIWVGTAIMLTVVIDSVTDPLIGLFSDRLRSPLGRRHTLMYASAIPAALGVYLMWHAPHGLAPAPLLAFMIAMLIFVNIALSLYEIPSLALAPELAPDYDRRSKLLAWRWLFLIVGGAAINVILYQVFLREDTANPLGVLNRERWEDFGVFAAVVIFVAIVLSTAATHGRIKHLHTPPVQAFSWRRTIDELRVALSHKPLVMIMLGGLFMGFGAGTTAGLAAYFNLHFWGLKPQSIAYIVAAAVPASLLALWAGPWFGARFGKKQAIIGLYFAWLLTATGPIALRLVGLMPANGDPMLLWILVGNFTVSLALALSCHINLGSCVADSIDDIAVKIGRQSEGTMFGAYSVLDKCANGGGAFVAGAILFLVAFPTNAVPGSVSPEILTRMALINLPIIVVFNLGSIYFLSRYSLTRAEHARNAAILAERRSADAAELERAAGVRIGGSPLIP